MDSVNSDSTRTIQFLIKSVKHFVSERHWEKYHNPKDLAMSISIEAAELLEAFQWMPDAKSDAIAGASDKGNQIRDELADVLIYCLLLADRMGIDLVQATTNKIAKNSRKYPAKVFDGKYYKRR
jgi:dCTP diphosphatase